MILCKMIQNLLNKYFFYLYVFTLCFGVLLYNTTGFKGLDMVSGVILLVFYGIYLFGTKNRNFNIGFLVTILVFLFYLNYSFYISDNTRNAIASDFLTQIRPYIAFFIVLQMAPVFSEAQKSLLKKICFYLWLFFIPIGLYATINPSFLSIMMDQPSNFTACITCLSIVYLYCGDFSVKDKLTAVFMLSVGLLAVNSYFYVFFLLVCGLLMYFHHADVLKNNLRTGIALASVTGLIVYISRYEILNYIFPAGIAGNGFASLAIQASEFYTNLNEYGLGSSINGFISQEWFSSISGSYYPVLAQLGIVGIMLYLSFWVYIILLSIFRFRQNGEIQPFIITLMLATFIFIENITDSLFTSNKGYFMMMFIGLLLSKPEEAEDMIASTIKPAKKKKKASPIHLISSQGKRFLVLLEQKVQPIREITYMAPTKKTKKHEPKTESRKIHRHTNQFTPPVNDIQPAVTNQLTPPAVNNIQPAVANQLIPPPVYNIHPTVTNQLTPLSPPPPVVNEIQPSVLPAKEEKIEEIAAPVIVSVNVSAPEIKQPQIIEAVRPAVPLIEEEDDDEYEWEDDFEDEFEWDEEEDYIEEEEIAETWTPVNEITVIDTVEKEEIELVASPVKEEIELVTQPVEEEIIFVAPPVVKEEVIFVAPSVEEEIIFVQPPVVEEIKFVASPIQEEVVFAAPSVEKEIKFVAPLLPAREKIKFGVLPVEEEIEFVAPSLVKEKIEYVAPLPVKEERVITFNVLQNIETQPDKPTMPYSFSLPDESILKKASHSVENYENDDSSEDSFNYMI